MIYHYHVQDTPPFTVTTQQLSLCLCLSLRCCLLSFLCLFTATDFLLSLPFAAFLRFLCLSLHITIFHRLSLSRAFNAFCLCCHHLINFRCMQVGCLGPAVAEDGLDKPSARPRTAALILSIYPVYPLPLAGGPIGSGEGASAQ